MKTLWERDLLRRDPLFVFIGRTKMTCYAFLNTAKIDRGGKKIIRIIIVKNGKENKKKVGGFKKPRDKVKSHLWNRSRNSFSQRFKIIRTEIVRHRHASRSTRKQTRRAPRRTNREKGMWIKTDTRIHFSRKRRSLWPTFVDSHFLLLFSSLFFYSNKLSYRILLSLFASSLKPCECYQSSRLF